MADTPKGPGEQEKDKGAPTTPPAGATKEASPAFVGSPTELRTRLESLDPSTQNISDEEWEKIFAVSFRDAREKKEEADATKQGEKGQITIQTQQQIQELHDIIEGSGTLDEKAKVFAQKVEAIQTQSQAKIADLKEEMRQLGIDIPEEQLQELLKGVQEIVTQEHIDKEEQELSQKEKELDALGQKLGQELTADERNALIQQYEDKHEGYQEHQMKLLEKYVSLFARDLWFKELCEKKLKAGEKLTPQESKEYTEAQERIQQVRNTARIHELEGLDKRTKEQDQELSDLKKKMTTESLHAKRLQEFEMAKEMEGSSKEAPTRAPRPTGDIIRSSEKLPEGYTVQETKEYQDEIKKESKDRYEQVTKSVEHIVGVFESARTDIPKETLGTLENMLWRNASNNPNFSHEHPFLYHDIGTQQAFIYYPHYPPDDPNHPDSPGEYKPGIEICRATHGYGNIGSNRYGSGGTSLGSKELVPGFKGGKLKHRTEVHGLENGINNGDLNRLIRVHEIRGSQTAGCTGLPDAVAARLLGSIEKCQQVAQNLGRPGKAAQETFITNGDKLPENWGKTFRESSSNFDSFSNRLFSGGYTKAEADRFLERVDRNVLLKLMLTILAPFGIILAEARGDEVMTYFWERLMGTPKEDHDETQASGNAQNGPGRTSSGGPRVSSQPDETSERLSSTHETVEVVIDKERAVKMLELPPEEQQKMRVDAQGRLIRYKIGTGAKLGDDFSTFDKKFIAVHGTASYEKKGDGPHTPEFQSKLDISALNTGISGKKDPTDGVTSQLFPFLVSQHGLVFEFFDEEKGHGATNSDLANPNVGITDFNYQGIAIEISLASVQGGGVERPNDLQKQSTQALVGYLRGKHNIGSQNVITSADPVRDKDTGELVSGAHGDDFIDEDRLAWGGATKQQARDRLFSGEFFTDALATNPTIGDTELIAMIQKNEMGGDDNGLVWQNKKENFPSLGIGHFIWGTSTGHGNSFQTMIRYLEEERGVTIPSELAFLREANPPRGITREQYQGEAPWDKREKMIAFFQETKHDQLAYIKQRLIDFGDRQLSPQGQKNFDLMYAHAPAVLFDYINFKGGGDSTGTGSYGLQNVLDTMGPASSGSDALTRFQSQSKQLLAARSDSANWMDGWEKRIDRYSEYTVG